MPRLKFVAALIAAFVLGVAVALATVYMRPEAQPATTKPKHPSELSGENVSNLILYAELKDGYLEGTYFNQNADLKVVRITVETVPKDETNPFNKFTPRLFNVNATAQPRSMSAAFRVETGALNPEFHSLKLVEARGIASP
jgi:hypothetical protein